MFATCRVEFILTEERPTHMLFRWSNQKTVTVQALLPDGGDEVREMAANRENFVLSARRLDTTIKHYQDVHKIAFIPHWINSRTKAVYRHANYGIETPEQG